MRTEKKIFESCYILINPSRFPGIARHLKKVLKRYDASVVLITASKEDFINHVREFYHSTTFQHLLIWGGDGTAHLAVNTYISEQQNYPEEFNPAKAIGFMRGGSGNGIQDSYEVPLGILRQIDTYVESMKNDFTIRNDLMEIRSGSEARYGQLVGVGLDSWILDARNRHRFRFGKRKNEIIPGIISYVLSVLRLFLISWKKFRRNYRLEFRDGKYIFDGSRVNAQVVIDTLVRDVSVPQIEAGTRPYYAKFFKICPHVICNDGLIDVYLLNLKNKAFTLFNFINIYRGRHNRINNRLARREEAIIEHYKVKGLTISASEPFAYHIDGELFAACRTKGEYRINISVRKRAIRFLVPRKFYRKFHPFP
ncbi:MAG: sphingosine kinase [Spirochaetales bacterium]|nr:sphingosine kinase [Spirochaetales bacterium]